MDRMLNKELNENNLLEALERFECERGEASVVVKSKWFFWLRAKGGDPVPAEEEG